MQKLILVALALGLRSTASSQYWQQQTDYVIDVTLNEATRTLDAYEKISYTNHSPDTLQYIWFHLWPNAYKNDRTAFSEQLLKKGDTRFYFAEEEQRGYINRLDFRVDNLRVRTEDHPEHIDIIRLILPKPLPPGGNITISTPFHVKLPFNFSRGGYDGTSFQLTQWYPKPAVYDRDGWHPMPYLDQGEFYSEFGSYEVRITVPESYVVAATGMLQDSAEVDWLKTRKPAQAVPAQKHMGTSTAGSRKTSAPGKARIKPAPPSQGAIKTLHYRQDRVHDFAWFANPRFVVETDTCLLPSGRVVRISSFYTPEQQEQWKKSLSFTRDAIRFYSAQVGEYPYGSVSVVQGPESFGGGMEYPTITVISPMSSDEDLDETIAHEVGHNWFYGILASNERDHPWMDEGINTFYQYRYMEQKYGPQQQLIDILYRTKLRRGTAQPIETRSDRFSTYNYDLVAYHATATWLKDLERILSREGFDRMMQAYYKAWMFRHPQPADFKAMVVQNLPENRKHDTTSIFRALYQPTENPLQGFALVSPVKKGSIKNYLRHPVGDILFLSPAAGINSYDRLMLGGLVSNYKLPPSRFQFLAVPLYATGTKKLRGLGRLNYSFPAGGMVRKADVFVNGSVFSMDEFRDTAGRKLVMQFRKLVPGMKLTFREKDPTSTVRRSLQWKTFFIGEQSLRILRDTAIRGTDTSIFFHYLRPAENRWLNQLRFNYENHRALYPFGLEIQVEQARDFIRPALTARYFFNYREGGLDLRFFAGKFIYINGKTFTKQFDNERYFLNMTGPNGYEDYTYSDFFVGRNRFEEFASQQIMIRDGAFKVRTDLLASKVGKTDNWLTAVNLSTTIPQNLNPLSVLPVRIPLRLFLDIGTYAEAWAQDGDTDRFLYDAGFQIPLLNETFNLYIPMIYSKVYGDYFKSTIPGHRFFKTISFSIHFYNQGFKKINQELEF